MSGVEPPDDQRIVRPVIRVAPLGELKIWPVTEEELLQLEQGSPAELYLNFALSLLSVGASFLATLLATTIESVRVFIVFVIICVASVIAGVVLLALWWRGRWQIARLIDRIRARMPPPPGVPEQ